MLAFLGTDTRDTRTKKTHLGRLLSRFKSFLLETFTNFEANLDPGRLTLK